MTGIRSLLGADNATADAAAPAASKATSPETQAAIDAARANPDLRVMLDDGTEVSAAEAIAMIDSELKQANTDAQAFGAAVTCFLRTE